MEFTLNDISKAAFFIYNNAFGRKVFAFHGEMGSGKTTIISAICRLIEVESVVSSPTFSIIQEYKVRTGDSVYHIDLYRLKDEQEAIDAGVEEILYSGNVCFVEWPEKALGILPEDVINVHLTVIDETTRIVNIPALAEKSF